MTAINMEIEPISIKRTCKLRDAGKLVDGQSSRSVLVQLLETTMKSLELLLSDLKKGKCVSVCSRIKSEIPSIIHESTRSFQAFDIQNTMNEAKEKSWNPYCELRARRAAWKLNHEEDPAGHDVQLDMSFMASISSGVSEEAF